jgi:serine/threonine protein kinase
MSWIVDLIAARGPETPLTWHMRLSIAAGAARGLAHLHDAERIVHGNLTSGNILLDARLGPRLSDFGLSRLMTSAANAAVVATAAALGYRAPELTKLRRATPRSDVYSFGVVLLELLTGKSPADAAAGGGEHTAGLELPEWVASIVKEEWTNEIFDLELMRGGSSSVGSGSGSGGAHGPSEDELISTLQLAMNCVAPSPSARPPMADVSRHLDDILRRPEHNSAAAMPTNTTTSSDSSSSAP